MKNDSRAAHRAATAYCVLIIAALLLLPHLERPLRHFGTPDATGILTGKSPAVGLLLGAGAGLALSALGYLITRRTRWGRTLDRVVRGILGPLHPGDALLLAALSSAGEELIFRGILLPYMGIVGSSALFGLAHLVPRRTLWPWSVWATLVGLGLAYLANRTGGLIAPFALHFTVNAVSLVMISRGSK